MALMISGPVCGYCRRIRPLYDKVCADLCIEPRHIMYSDYDGEVESVPCLINKEGKKMYGGNHNYDELKQFFIGDK